MTFQHVNSLLSCFIATEWKQFSTIYAAVLYWRPCGLTKPQLLNTTLSTEADVHGAQKVLSNNGFWMANCFCCLSQNAMACLAHCRQELQQESWKTAILFIQDRDQDQDQDQMFKTKTKTSWPKTKTKTFIFVLEAPRDQDMVSRTTSLGHRDQDRDLATRSRDRDRDLDKMNSSALESRDRGLKMTTLIIWLQKCRYLKNRVRGPSRSLRCHHSIQRMRLRLDMAVSRLWPLDVGLSLSELGEKAIIYNCLFTISYAHGNNSTSSSIQ